MGLARLVRHRSLQISHDTGNFEGLAGLGVPPGNGDLDSFVLTSYTIRLSLSKAPELGADPPKYSCPSEFVTSVTVYVGFVGNTNLPHSLRSTALEGIVNEREATYFVASRRFLKPPEASMNRVQHMILQAMQRNSSSASDYFSLPGGRAINISVGSE